jgi:hypothetical protein
MPAAEVPAGAAPGALDVDDDDLVLVRDLLRDQRLLALAVVVGGAPVAGLVPFLGAPWSGVVHVPDGRVIGGFATARNLSASDFEKAGTVP